MSDYKCSENARLVLRQTELEESDFENLWFVERMLQIMKMNALVKMINQSKDLSPSYIEGYLPRFSWGKRKKEEQVDISKYKLEYLKLSTTSPKDFSWFNLVETLANTKLVSPVKMPTLDDKISIDKKKLLEELKTHAQFEETG